MMTLVIIQFLDDGGITTNWRKCLIGCRNIKMKDTNSTKIIAISKHFIIFSNQADSCISIDQINKFLFLES